MLKRLTRRERILALVTMGLCVFGAFFVLLIRPGIAAWDDIGSRIQEETKLLKGFTQLITAGEQVQKEYELYKDRLSEEQTDEEVVTNLKKEVHNIGAQNDTTVSEFKEGQVETLPYYRQYTVDLTVQGSPANFEKFLCALQNSPKLLRVEEMHVVRAAHNPNNIDSLKGTLRVSRALVSAGTGSESKTVAEEPVLLTAAKKTPAPTATVTPLKPPEPKRERVSVETIIKNGSMEKWSGGAGKPPDGWEGRNVSPEQNLEYATDGEYCVKIIGQGPAARFLQRVSLENGKSYVLKCKAAVKEGSATLRFRGSMDYFTDIDMPLSGETMTEYTQNIPITQTTEYWACVIYFNSPGVVYLDQVSLVESGATTPKR